MTAALIKPLGFQRTLTTWTDRFFFFFFCPHSRQGKNVCISFSLKTAYLASAVLVYVSSSENKCTSVNMYCLTTAFELRWISDILLGHVDFISGYVASVQQEKRREATSINGCEGGFGDRHNLAVWLLGHLFAWKLRAPSWWWKRINIYHSVT